MAKRAALNNDFMEKVGAVQHKSGLMNVLPKTVNDGISKVAENAHVVGLKGLESARINKVTPSSDPLENLALLIVRGGKRGSTEVEGFENSTEGHFENLVASGATHANIAAKLITTDSGEKAVAVTWVVGGDAQLKTPNDPKYQKEYKPKNTEKGNTTTKEKDESSKQGKYKTSKPKENSTGQTKKDKKKPKPKKDKGSKNNDKKKLQDTAKQFKKEYPDPLAISGGTDVGENSPTNSAKKPKENQGKSR